MQLSAEEYQTLVHSMRPYGTRRPGDKRKHLRVDATSEVTIIPVITGKPLRPVSVGVFDLSRQGIRIVHARRMELGQQFILCLSYNEDVGKTRPIICVVRRIEQGKKGEYHMGCEFTDNNRSEVATDAVLKGLEKYQASLFDADTAALYDNPDEPPRKQRPSPMNKFTSLFRRKSA